MGNSFHIEESISYAEVNPQTSSTQLIRPGRTVKRMPDGHRFNLSAAI